jgi:alpha-L-fucosidase
MSQAMAVGGEWTLLDEGGGTAVTFTSFVDIDLRNEGQALSYPIEEGSFANYNKVDTPLDIRVTLATQGSNADFEYILAKLDEYKREAVKLSVSTPSALYESMTLETYSYKRSREANAGMLTVELSLIEVREVQTQVTTTVISKPKNPTSSGKTNTGKTQTQESGSVLYDITH